MVGPRLWALAAPLVLVVSLVLAGSAYAQQQPSELERRYEETFDAMMADLDNPELSFQFVKVATEAGDLRGAISALERILLIKPNLANIKLELGILYLRLGANDLAETFLHGRCRHLTIDIQDVAR